MVVVVVHSACPASFHHQCRQCRQQMPFHPVAAVAIVVVGVVAVCHLHWLPFAPPSMCCCHSYPPTDFPPWMAVCADRLQSSTCSSSSRHSGRLHPFHHPVVPVVHPAIDDCMTAAAAVAVPFGIALHLVQWVFFEWLCSPSVVHSPLPVPNRCATMWPDRVDGY